MHGRTGIKWLWHQLEIIAHIYCQYSDNETWYSYKKLFHENGDGSTIKYTNKSSITDIATRYTLLIARSICHMPFWLSDLYSREEVELYPVGDRVGKQRRFFVDNLMPSVQLANISTRCSSYPQGKVKQGAKFIEVAPELVCVCSPESGGTLTLAQLEYTPPPTSSWSPSSSLVTRNSILVELAGIVWMCKASFTLSWTGLAALSKYPYIYLA